jgi:hypothetical protein
LISYQLSGFGDKEFDNFKPKKNAKGNRMFTHQKMLKTHNPFTIGKRKRFYIRRCQNSFEKEG